MWSSIPPPIVRPLTMDSVNVKRCICSDTWTDLDRGEDAREEDAREEDAGEDFATFTLGAKVIGGRVKRKRGKEKKRKKRERKAEREEKVTTKDVQSLSVSLCVCVSVCLCVCVSVCLCVLSPDKSDSEERKTECKFARPETWLEYRSYKWHKSQELKLEVLRQSHACTSLPSLTCTFPSSFILFNQLGQS